MPNVVRSMIFFVRRISRQSFNNKTTVKAENRIAKIFVVHIFLHICSSIELVEFLLLSSPLISLDSSKHSDKQYTTKNVVFIFGPTSNSKSPALI